MNGLKMPNSGITGGHSLALGSNEAFLSDYKRKFTMKSVDALSYLSPGVATEAETVHTLRIKFRRRHPGGI